MGRRAKPGDDEFICCPAFCSRACDAQFLPGANTKSLANNKLRRGLIAANDLFIATHALALGCTIVTDNEREFSRIKGLPIENWLC